MKRHHPLYLGVTALLAAGAWVALRPPDLPDYSPAAQVQAAVEQEKRDPVAGKLAASAVLSIDPRANPVRPGSAAPAQVTLFGEYLAALRTQVGIPGLSAAIVGPGDLQWEGHYGQQDVGRNLPARFDTDVGTPVTPLPWSALPLTLEGKY